jgi:hypothetical protein
MNFAIKAAAKVMAFFNLTKKSSFFKLMLTARFYVAHLSVAPL